MALSDEQILVVSVYILSLGITLAFGMKKHPMFFIFAGIIGIVLGIEIWNLTNIAMPNASSIIAAIIIGLGVMIMTWGFVSKPNTTRG